MEERHVKMLEWLFERELDRASHGPRWPAYQEKVVAYAQAHRADILASLELED